MKRNEIFTVQDVIKLYNEFQSYETMWNDALEDYILREYNSPTKRVEFNEWFQFYIEGWSNDEIIAGIRAHSIEE